MSDQHPWSSVERPGREQFFQAVFEQSAIGVAIVELNGRPVLANGALERFLHYSVAELNELTYHAITYPDDLALDAELATQLAGGKVDHYVVEKRYVRKDSRVVWGMLTVSILRTAAGEPQFVLAMVEDIDDRKRAELALRESEVKYRGLVEHAPHGILIHCDGRIVFANDAAAQLLGAATPSVLLGQMALAFFDPTHLGGMRDRLVPLKAPGTVVPMFEERIVRLDGSTFEAEIAGTAITYKGHLAWQLVIRDLTERRRVEANVRNLEEQFRHSQRMDAVGQLVGGIAHDFNNLLTVINSYSEALLNQLDPTNALHGDAVEIQRAGARAVSLTQQLLAFSRKQALQPTTLGLNTIIAELEAMLRRLIGEHIQVVSHHAPDLWPVRADRGQLEQLLTNLAVNARDAMPDGGTLAIETANVHVGRETHADHPALAPGGYVMLTVRDTGIGMDAATKSRVFEPFFTTKSVGRGTGLGLSTVFGIVAQFEGHIWCDSEPGRGTTFSVYLPRAGTIEASVAQPTRAPISPSGAEVLLLVEDEDQVRTLARRILERHGYTILEARDGRDALRVASNYAGHIDMLLSDVVMPELAGHEVLEALSVTRPRLRVLFMSGYAEHDSVRRALARAETAFLQKPFTTTALAEAVRAVLDRHEPGSEQSTSR